MNIFRHSLLSGLCLWLGSAAAQPLETVVQIQHSLAITAVDASPDGKFIATGSADRNVRIWETQSGRMVTQAQVHGDMVTDVRFSPLPSVHWIYSISDEDNEVICYDYAAGQEVMRYRIPGYTYAHTIGFCNGGRNFWIAGQTRIFYYETGKSEPLNYLYNGRFFKNDDRFNNVYIDSTGTILYTTRGDTLITAEFPSGNILSKRAFTSHISAFSFSGSAGMAVLCRKDDWAVYRFKGPEFSVQRVFSYYRNIQYPRPVISPDGRFVMIRESDELCRLISLDSMKTVFGMQIDAEDFTFTGNKVVITGQNAQKKIGMSFVDLKSLEQLRPAGISNPMQAMEYDPSGTWLATAGQEGGVILWDVHKADVHLSLPVPEGSVMGVKWNHAGNRLAVAMNDRRLLLFSVPDFKKVFEFQGQTPQGWGEIAGSRGAGYQEMLFSHDDRFLYVSLFSKDAYSDKGTPFMKLDISTGKIVAESGVVKGNMAVGLAADTSGRLMLGTWLGSARILDPGSLNSKKSINEEYGFIQNPVVDPAGKWFAIEKRGNIEIYSSNGKLQKTITTTIDDILSMTVSPDGKFLAAAGGFSDYSVYLIRTADWTIADTFRGHSYEVVKLAFSPDGKTLVSAGADSRILFWNMDNRSLRSTLIYTYGTATDYVFYTPSGFYKATRGALDIVAFRQGLKLFGFEQFDALFNRPDEVILALSGEKNANYELYRKASLKRAKKHERDNSKYFASDAVPQSFSFPEIVVVSAVPSVADGKMLRVQVSLKDSTGDITHVQVYDNGVPVYGLSGKPLTSVSALTELEIPLVPGRNHLEISCRNDKGLESSREMFRVFAPKAIFPEPRKYFIAVGVSDYGNPEWNLRYAVKDGKDLAALFGKKATVDTLFNSRANRNSILEIRNRLMNTNPGDEVILFFSGHGLLDESLEFRYAASGVDFSNPRNGGVSYDEIEGLFDGIPARGRVLLIDACHSGDVDPDAVAAQNRQKLEAGARGAGAETSVQEDLSSELAFEAMNTLFANTSCQSGAYVISASVGKGYALESDRWNNGAFTYVLKKGLKEKSADANADGIIGVSELRNYVITTVPEITGGRQQPTCRRENLRYDIPVWP